MPYKTEWTPPAVFLEYKDTKVYHSYKDDEADQPVRQYWYVWNEEDGEDDAFDIRDLPNPEDHDVDTEEGQKEILKRYIEDREDLQRHNLLSEN